jgi:4-hydroxyphenylpyruvate dioxygenase-like putative hemolysin
MNNRVKAFVHLEMVHPDPDAAASFMQGVFGAELVEQQLSAYLESLAPGMRIVHVLLGGVVFQFVKPVPGNSWHQLLEAQGPSVHNVTFQIDDLEQVRKDLLAKGCNQVSQFDMTMQDGGLNVAGRQRAYVIDALAQSGLRFEMIETMPEWIPAKAP